MDEASRGTLMRVVRQGWRYRGIVVLLLGTSALQGGLTSLQAKLFKDILDQFSLIAAGLKGAGIDLPGAMEGLQRVGLISLGLAPLMALSAYAAYLTGQYLANRCMRDLRDRFLAHVVGQELAWHLQLTRGDLISRMTNDLDRMFTVQSVIYGRLVRNPVGILALVGFLFWLNWRFAAVLLLVMLPLGVLIARGLRKVRRRSHAAQETLSRNLSAFEQITAGFRVIKAMGSGEREVERYQVVNGELYADRQKVARARAQSEGLTQGSIFLVGGVAMLAGVWLFGRRWMEPTELLAAMGAIAMIANLLREVQRSWGDVEENLPSAGRVYAVLDRAPAVQDRPGAPAMPRPRQAIRLEQVSFRYAPGADDVLAGVDLEVPVGRTVALVGESGTGKSTILDLIPRFHDVTGGRITWDGIDVREVAQDSLIHQVAIVGQDSFLFNDTVYANILYGRPGATREEVETAARRAHVHEAILGLEGGQGYQTCVGDRGCRLSGGQRQRVAIARALLRDAPVLLLDEPTSALDAESERHVQEALAELMTGRTTIVVAHRLATIQHADRIYVLGQDQRGVVEQGTHAELVARDGVYAAMVAKQTLL